MAPGISIATFLHGLIIGWSVAWPPGPVNAEMIRRGLLPKAEGGGFWSAWRVGLGACTGDFIWALGVSLGAGALLNTPRVRFVLGVISLVLLLVLAAVFARAAWQIARTHRVQTDSIAVEKRRTSHGYLLGLTVVLASPWNIGFWLAIIGSQPAQAAASLSYSLFLAGAVVLGAIAWGCVLCVLIRLGARIFSRPGWQIATQALSALVMLYFAAQVVMRLTAHPQ
jgi:threonine/homoserine/homoserine lactone efflux protein